MPGRGAGAVKDSGETLGWSTSHGVRYRNRAVGGGGRHTDDLLDHELLDRVLWHVPAEARGPAEHGTALPQFHTQSRIETLSAVDWGSYTPG